MIAGRVIMLSSDQGLAAIAGQLVGRGQPLTRFASPAEVPDWLRPPTGAVVLDFPRRVRGIVYRQLRQRYRGPVLVLLDPDEDSSGLPTDHCRLGVLHRPFSGEDLSTSLDALVGPASRNGAREPKSPSLTAPPVGTDQTFSAAAIASAAPATLPAPGPLPTPATPAAAAKAAAVAAAATAAARAAVGSPAVRVTARGARRRRLSLRHLQPGTRRRVNSLIVTLAALAALVVGVTLSDGRGCRSPGCGNVASAKETSGVGAPLVGPIPTPLPGEQSATGSAKGTATKPAAGGAATDQRGPSMVIPIASGVSDLISGTSSSSGGAPLLVVTPGSGSGSGGGSGGSGGGTPPPTTLPSVTTSPVTTVPPTTVPPTTEPPTTVPPTTVPPTTEPPTTVPPTTVPPTTEPPTTVPTTTDPPPATTAATTAPTETVPPGAASSAI